MVFIMMVLKRLCLLPSNAKADSLIWRGTQSGAINTPIVALIASYSTSGCIARIVTSSGGSSLKLNVSGTRRIDALSAVRDGSASNSCSSHNALRRSATGFHCNRSITLVNLQ